MLISMTRQIYMWSGWSCKCDAMFLSIICKRWHLCLFTSLDWGGAIPCSVDEVVCVRPVTEQVGGLHIIHSDVHVSEGLWEKVVNLPCHIENIAHTEKNTQTELEPQHWLSKPQCTTDCHPRHEWKVETDNNSRWKHWLVFLQLLKVRCVPLRALKPDNEREAETRPERKERKRSK